MEEHPHPTAVSEPPPRYPRPEWLDEDEIREEAEFFLHEFWPEGTAPVNIEEIVDTRAGLDIVPARGVFRAYGIDGFLSSDMTTIFVDEDLAGGATLHRYRFTLAHEIGHWYLHEALYAAADYRSPEDFLRFRAELPPNALASYEWQARQFAGLILVPPRVLEATLAEAIEFAHRKGLDPLDLRNAAQRSYVAEWIGRRLEVSGDVVRRRGVDDGYWER